MTRLFRGCDRASLYGGTLRRAQTFLQLLTHSRCSLQFRPGLEQVLSQLIALDRESLKAPTQLFRLVFMLFRALLSELPCVIYLHQPMAFCGCVALLELGAFGLVGSRCGVELVTPIRASRLDGLDPRPEASAFRITLSDAGLQRLRTLVGFDELFAGKGKAIFQRGNARRRSALTVGELVRVGLQNGFPLDECPLPLRQRTLQGLMGAHQCLVPELLESVRHALR